MPGVWSALGCNVLGDAAELAGLLESFVAVDIRISGGPPTPDAIAEHILVALKRPARTPPGPKLGAGEFAAGNGGSGRIGCRGSSSEFYAHAWVGDEVVTSRSVNVKPASRARRTGQVSATFSRRLTWSSVRWSGRWMVISTCLGVVSAS